MERGIYSERATTLPIIFLLVFQYEIGLIKREY